MYALHLLHHAPDQGKPLRAGNFFRWWACRDGERRTEGGKGREGLAADFDKISPSILCTSTGDRSRIPPRQTGRIEACRFGQAITAAAAMVVGCCRKSHDPHCVQRQCRARVLEAGPVAISSMDVPVPAAIHHDPDVLHPHRMGEQQQEKHQVRSEMKAA
jgi:hypothetical protein